MIVKEGDKIELGKHILFCIEASMVHWPEVIVIYDSFTGTLFSSDAFGNFWVNDINEPWEEEAKEDFILVYLVDMAHKFKFFFKN